MANHWRKQSDCEKLRWVLSVCTSLLFSKCWQSGRANPGRGYRGAVSLPITGFLESLPLLNLTRQRLEATLGSRAQGRGDVAGDVVPNASGGEGAARAGRETGELLHELKQHMRRCISSVEQRFRDQTIEGTTSSS